MKTVVMAIKMMENNKAVGTDGIQVEMMKCNAGKAAQMLTGIWKFVGSTRIVPKNWLKGIVVPLYKGKGEQANPKHSRPLTIISHLRKVTEKAVVIELEKEIQTDRSQFGFQAGVQILQAALNILAAIKAKARFITVLDLAKAYDSIVKTRIYQKLKDTIDENIANQLLVFLLKVRAQVAGDITKTDIIMRKGLTQGGTSSPALFKLYISDLPDHIRKKMRDKGKDIAELDPIRLVADDAVISTEEEDGLQIALNACHSWARTNRLLWNSAQSQVLNTQPEAGAKDTVKLGGVNLAWADEVEYLGLRLSKDGFLGKQLAEVEEKGRGAVHMLTNEVWFNMHLEPKFITREFISRVRSVMLYGSELLTTQAREPFLELDEKLTNLFLTKLLKIRQAKLAKKHQHRLQIALGIPTLGMDIDKAIQNRIRTWIEKRTSESKQLADRASDSLRDITKLDMDHPLCTSLNKFTPHTGMLHGYGRYEWLKMETEKRGTQYNPVDRQLKASSTNSLKVRSVSWPMSFNLRLNASTAASVAFSRRGSGSYETLG